MKLKKVIPWLVVGGIGLYGFNIWMDKPYCNIEYLDKLTLKGKLNPVVYAVTKFLSQRKDLKGNDPYKMYIYVHDPDGLESITLTVDGNTRQAELDDPYTFETEMDGKTEFAMHHYHVTATDKKGNTSESSAFIKVSNIGAGLIR